MDYLKLIRSYNPVLRRIFELMDKETKKILSNRQKTRLPKMGKYWCSGCDAYKVGCGQKCPNCGHKEGVREKK